MTRSLPVVALLVCLALLAPACGPLAVAEASVQQEQLVVRVVDVGAGLCCVATIPGSDGTHYMIYDAGNYEDKGSTAMTAITELIPEGSDVDLLVLSHSDSDHIAAVPKICTKYKVQKIVRTGMTRDSATWKNADTAIKSEAEEGCEVVNLSTTTLTPGDTATYGDATVTLVCGFGEPPDDWGSLDESEEKNAGSIVVRLVYKDKSILFCEDAVGRHIGGPSEQCIATEKFMVDNSDTVEIDSDVVIAPHHGGDNGSSTQFIKKVTPEWVIFSAGHRYRHPRRDAAERYLAEKVKLKKMLRTDRGDDEGDGDKVDSTSDDEWDNESVDGATDKKGDDDIEITIKANGKLAVGYR